MTKRGPSVLIVGVGPGLGSALARRFSQEGLRVCLARRRGELLEPLCTEIEAAGGFARAFACDARKEEAIIALFDTIEAEVGPLEVVIFNVGGNVKIPFLEMTTRKYYKLWEMAAFSGFLVGREAARRMVPRGKGTILMTGATASVRGAAGFSGFAGAKHALRALSQSMARELGPMGIHVAHVIVDGVIDTPWARENFPDLYAQKGARDGILDPDHIAEAYWQLHRQPRTAWTQEMDLRPWIETF